MGIMLPDNLIVFGVGCLQILSFEQVLMRSLKTSGGLRRGRGMTELQHIIWLLSYSINARVNLASCSLQVSNTKEVLKQELQRCVNSGRVSSFT